MFGYNSPTIRTTEEGEQVGPRMHMAVTAAARRSWQSKNELAKHVGPHSSQQYGYNVVDRCIKKGLITRPDPDHPEANPHGRGAIEATEKGEAYVERHQD